MKRFSTVRDTQRGSQVHGEEKREEGDSGDQKEKRGIKRGERILAINQLPMCSPVWSPQKGSQSYIEKRRGRKKIEVIESKGERPV